MNIAIGVITFLLIIVSLFLVLVVLAQKAKSDGGVGAAMGGGMAEAAFGADTGNVLSRSTIYASIAFFVLCFVLFLAHLRRDSRVGPGGGTLPSIAAPAAPALPPIGTPAAGGTPSLATPATGTTGAPALAAPATGSTLTVPSAPAAPATEAPKAP